MTLEESLRRHFEPVTHALGLVERVPAEPTEPHDLLSRECPKFEPDDQAYQDFLMGTPEEESGRRPRA